jgi:hypothetical protein
MSVSRPGERGPTPAVVLAVITTVIHGEANRGTAAVAILTLTTTLLNLTTLHLHVHDNIASLHRRVFIGCMKAQMIKTSFQIT